MESKFFTIFIGCSGFSIKLSPTKTMQINRSPAMRLGLLFGTANALGNAVKRNDL
jgi:hypothetical protein